MKVKIPVRRRRGEVCWNPASSSELRFRGRGADRVQRGGGALGEADYSQKLASLRGLPFSVSPLEAPANEDGGVS